MPELNYRTSLKGFSFIFSKESFEQTDMSLLDELKNILLKKSLPLTYLHLFGKELFSFCLRERAKKKGGGGKKNRKEIK